MQKQRHILLLVLIAEVMFVSLGVSVKAVSDRIPVYEIAFFRSFLSVLFLGLLLSRQKVSFRSENPPLIMFRALVGSAAMFCNFYAIGHLALGDAAMLINTFPLFVPVLAFLFLGEKISKKLIGLILFSFAGILLILRPQFGFMNLAGCIALLGALFASMDVLAIHLSFRSDPALRLAFYMSLVASIISLPIMVQNYVHPTTLEWVFLFAAGIFGTGAQCAIISAYGRGDITKLAPLAYLAVVLSFAAGALWWNEIPSIWSAAGTLMVILGCIWITRLKKVYPEVS